MDVLLANPRGFCAGVDRAIEIVKRAIDSLGAPIYVRHEVVHNRFVVDDLKQRGAVFVEELDEVPDGSTVIFSAHGVSQAVRSEADRRGLKVFDYGRSKVGTGPYAFKRNWGFEPTPLNYEYRLYKRESIPQNNPANPKYRLMIETWRRLPLPVANWLGPHIVRNLG